MESTPHLPPGGRPQQQWGELPIVRQEGGLYRDGERSPSSTRRVASIAMGSAPHPKIETGGKVRKLPSGVMGLPSEPALHMWCDDTCGSQSGSVADALY
jgi:hypothetical protein